MGPTAGSLSGAVVSEATLPTYSTYLPTFFEVALEIWHFDGRNLPRFVAENEKFEIRVSQHASIVPMARSYFLDFKIFRLRGFSG